MVVTPGAYLSTDIETYPEYNKIYLTPGNTSLKAYYKNLVSSDTNPENNTAYNVNFNWTISSTIEALLVTGYNLTSTSAILNTTAKKYNNLTITLNSSNLPVFNPGVYTFIIYTYGYENSTGNLTLIEHVNNQTILNDSVAINFHAMELKIVFM